MNTPYSRTQQAPANPSELTPLWQDAAQGLRALYGCAPAFRAIEGEAGMAALSGVPLADLNMGVLWQGAGAVELLARIDALELPLVMLWSGQAATDLAGTQTRVGYIDCGTVPLMVRSGPCAPPAGQAPSDVAFKVRRVSGAQDLVQARRLIAQSFGLEEEPLTRAFADGLLERADVAVYLAERSGQAVSTVMVTRHGKRAGVWSMATPTELQRQGLGRALLQEVMQGECAGGMQTFFLLATAAGQHLYEQLGFEVLEPAQVWLRGQSAQV